MERRKKIRIISFTLALCIGLTAWGVTATVQAKKYKTTTNLARQRALIQLCECLDGIETSLTKTVYAQSGKMLANLSNEMSTQASGAKTSLSVLSAGETELYNIYKFLSQVGDYTASLNLKAASGGKITAREREELKNLLGYAQSMSRQFSYLSELMHSRYLSFEELDKTLSAANEAGESSVTYMSGVSDAEKSMADYPSLIYDGPFSDNILSKESAMLKNAKDVTQNRAREYVAELMKTQAEKVGFEGETSGRIPSYTFSFGNSRFAVTKQGGYLAYMITEYVNGEEKLTSSDCIEKASAFLYDCGYTNMVSTYFSSFDGVCTVNFAYYDGTYICYPDLIKVGVSLTDGKIVSLEATDYIMNHIQRDIPVPEIDLQQAKSTVAQSLSVKKGFLSVIPTPSGGENYAYELLCRDNDGRDVLVYVDTVTGEQDDILILLHSDGGTLTK